MPARRALAGYFWPTQITDDRWQDTRIRIVCGFSLVIGSGAALHNLMAILFTDGLSNLAVGLTMLVVLGYFVVPAIALRTRNITFAGTILIALLALHCNILVISDTTTQWRHETYMVGSPVVALLLLGRRHGFGWVVLIAADLVFLSTLPHGAPPASAYPLILLIVAIVGGLSIFQNEINANARLLHQLRKDAQRADQAKSEFLAKMSHEIRTPMNGLSGILQLLDDTPLNDTQKELIDVGRASGKTLLRLINDILDYSKIAADGITLESVALPTDQIVAPVVMDLFAQAQDNGVFIRYDIDQKLPKWIMGDPTRLRQVMTNLVSNAVKFSGNGTVSICIKKDAEMVVVTVTDTGIGMAQDVQDRIFNKFEQATAATNRHYGGTGLGLAIAKELVELQGGTIGVTSALGKGSSFWFSFPLIASQAPASPHPMQSPARDHAALDLIKGSRVLVVEDNRTNQLIVRRFLESMGIEPEVVEDGISALEICAVTPFHMILMDIQLPGMDGVEASRMLRTNNGPNQNTPIVALSANMFPEQTASYVQAGIDACLGKPFRKSELADVMVNLTKSPPRNARAG